ncbi:MAG: Gfo/Idh/MocA family oxidoreductase [Armatimonadetes bacterium]|nr:Gfo/Idh/MocA family oxidoreductase [Armatimonadota bacterium]
MPRLDRRRLLQTTTAAGAAGVGFPSLLLGQGSMAQESRSPNSRPRVGCIGMGGMGRGDARAARAYGDLLAFCDVDRTHAEQANADPNLGAGKGTVYEDYRKLLERKDIDVVTISTPDHWHTRICLDALRAGKDIYCQKPLTLTIDEGKLLCQAVHESGRVLQVGTQQRSEYRNMFLMAVALVREGRIGKVRRVTCAIGGAPTGGPFKKTTPPSHLNWDMWLGPAPLEEYIAERGHANFRWWYEYSGGKLTDWGAHHVDIAQWAIGMERSGPTTIEPLSVRHPVPFVAGHPTVDDRYNTATEFQVRCLFPNQVEMIIRHDTENGVLFEGEKGSFFVSRGKLTGAPVDELRTNPISDMALIMLRKGKRLDRHMGNFMECVRDRSLPASDVYSHHRVLTTCHLANIAIRLGRKLQWDPVSEQIVGDSEANNWLGREPRKGYEYEA